MGKHFLRYLQITGYFLLGALLGGVLLWLTKAMREPISHNATLTQETPWWSQAVATLPVEPSARVGWLLLSREPVPTDVTGLQFEASVLAAHFQSLGYAVLIDESKLLTASHVWKKGEEMLYFYNNDFGLREVTLFERQEARDLAWGELETAVVLEPVEIASSLESGQKVHVWQKKASRTDKVDGEILKTKKIISLQETWGETRQSQMSVIALKMKNNLGDSGSAVFDEQERLLGVIIGVDLNDLDVTYVSPVAPNE